MCPSPQQSFVAIAEYEDILSGGKPFLFEYVRMVCNQVSLIGLTYVAKHTFLSFVFCYLSECILS